MRTLFDQVGKQLLRASLDGCGTFTSPLEVTPDPQQADGYFEPNLSKPSPVEGTLLGRMTVRACAFEMFSEPPNGLEMEGCFRKHLNHRHILRKTLDEAKLPHQWIFSAGRPSRAFESVWVRRAKAWPSGVYNSQPLDASSIVVINELPLIRSTLMVRLMGRGQTLRQAIAELRQLSDDDFEKCIALPLLVRYNIEAKAEPPSPAIEEFIVNTQEIVDMMERRAELRGELRGEQRGELRGELRGEQRGELRGVRKTVLRQLQRKFGVLPEDVVARVQNADTTLLEQLEDNVLFANSLAEVFPA